MAESFWLGFWQILLAVGIVELGILLGQYFGLLPATPVITAREAA